MKSFEKSFQKRRTGTATWDWETTRQDLSARNKVVKSEALDMSDRIYIRPFDGRDESMPNEGFSDVDMWQRLGPSLVRQFDAPAPDQATSPPSARTVLAQ